MTTTFRKLGLLLYKNYLVRKRQWKSALIAQILIPLFLFYNLKSIKTIVNMSTPRQAENQIFPLELEESFTRQNQFTDLYVVPDEPYIDTFLNKAKNCIGKTNSIVKFKTEKDMLDTFKRNSENTTYSRNMKAIVFSDFSANTKQLIYKLYDEHNFPSVPYQDGFNFFGYIYLFDPIIGLQICLDKAFIDLDSANIDVRLNMQKMVKPGVSEQGYGQKIASVVAVLVLFAFVLELIYESSKASDEKFLGVNVLMAMNGVPNYLNMFGWLLSGLIFSLFYIVPMIILLNIPFDDNAPLMSNGNSFILWLVLTLHAAHLFTFGMHISAYFRRSKFLVIALLVIYGGSTYLGAYLLEGDSMVPYLGILFPNVLLFRAMQEMVYYQSVSGAGIGFGNLFQVDDPAYGVAGSMGMIMILSILGAILHFILTNYICAINPGKYGAKRHPLYFLECLRRSSNPNHYDKVENIDMSNGDGRPFETVSEGAFTPGIQIRNLKKMYNVGLFGNAQVHALKGINIDFYQGQITSLLGHNGAGKTTMMSILTGMNDPTEGMVLMNGKNIKDNLDEIMTELGLCPQENIVFPNLSVYEQFKFFAMLKNRNKSNAMIEQNVMSLLEKLKLYEKRNILPKNLSGGQKRRVCLGMALVGDPSTLILDEPTSGLDPEIRREIWDILLKTRGEKTILISTHDMEEADILGDRIAIVHSGKLRSYGTAMFLKKLLGRGNIEVTLSTEPWCNPESVRTYFGHQSEILNTDGSKIVMSIPNTPELPDALDRIEGHKRNLGITGMSVSLITLEQVFLKVTRDNEDEVDSHEPLISASHKLSGVKQSMHAANGLLRKKALYTLKNLSTPLLMLGLTLLMMFMVYILKEVDPSEPEYHDPIKFRLDAYHKAKVFYQSEGGTRNFGEKYEAAVKQFGGQATKLSNDVNMTEYLLNNGLQNYPDYKTHVISAASFSSIEARAIYNDLTATYAKPIAMNLVTNGILKTLKGSDYSIEITGQTFPKQLDINTTISIKEGSLEAQKYSVPIVMIFFLVPVVALFIIHPLLETDTNVKHLQRMTGLSSFNYWGTMLLFDLVVMLILTIIVVVGFFFIDLLVGSELMKLRETLIISLLMILFALSVLPFIYCFSFWFNTTSSAMKLLTLVPLGLVICEGVLSILLNVFPDNSTLKIIRPIEKGAFLLTPYGGFVYGTVSFFKKSIINGACRQLSKSTSAADHQIMARLCKNQNCHDGDCKNPEPYFGDFGEDLSLELGLLSMAVTAVLYSVLLWLLENKLIPIMIARSRADKPASDHDADEQVQRVKRNIAEEISDIQTKSSQVIANSRSADNIENGVPERHVFLVHELRKRYGSLVAVQDITFGVNQSECFGLLGVNGAGKSTTFRMMTGEEIPNNGTMFLNEEELTGTRESHRSQMGYCPQNDAVIRSLNAYDHLRLFARLRAIPESEVENEVRKWIKRLNLNACAAQPSGTYSGGNKRRLNIAISMIGVPDLVLLDEPTTGVDPAARRSLWNVIKSSQRTTGQAVILTSHSMEECEALCSRLAIMVGGKFVCIGPSQELKQRFGAGYDIQIKLNPEKAMVEVEGIKRDIEAALQCELIDENSCYLMYHISSTATKWRKMYDVMSSVKNKYSSVDDFSVLSSTLEQLFLLFARAANRSH